MEKINKVLIGLGIGLISGTIGFLSYSKKRRKELVKEEPEKEEEKEEKQNTVQNEQERLRDLYWYHYNQFFETLRQSWPLEVDPETPIMDINEIDYLTRRALIEFGIYRASGLLYYYKKKGWNGCKKFMYINGIGTKRSIALVHYIKHNVKDRTKMGCFYANTVEKCAQTFYNYKTGETNTYFWL